MNEILFWLGRSTSGLLSVGAYRLVFLVPPQYIGLTQTIQFKSLSNSYMQVTEMRVDYDTSRIYVIVNLSQPVNLGQTNIVNEVVAIASLAILNVSLEEIQRPFTLSEFLMYAVILLILYFLIRK